MDEGHNEAKRGNVEMDRERLATETIELAESILSASRRRETSEQRARSELMARMMLDPPGKRFTIALADQVLRVIGPRRAARRLNSLIRKFGVPEFLPWSDRTSIRVGSRLASLVPGLFVPLVKRKIRDNSSHVIFSAEAGQIERLLQRQRQDGLRTNFNQLGEAVLGEREAARRLNENVQRLLDPEFDFVSVKLSAIASQISLVGYDATLEMLKERLRSLYRAAIEGGAAKNADPKFVNLDMEEYRDLQLTVDVFTSVLDEPEFESLTAGMVLQAYLPDAFAMQHQLTEWALDRYHRTGGRIRVRLVKGANLAMEKIDAALHDWPQAPYHTKQQSDANFKRMLEFGSRSENTVAVSLGIGSHNLFDIALAMLLRFERKVEQQVQFEMLAGMAPGQARELADRAGHVLMYTPVVHDKEFEAAVAYLVRRLDENTEPGSFLGELFSLQPGSAAWNQQAQAFRESLELVFGGTLSASPQRTQNRLEEHLQPRSASDPFANEPNTDFSLPTNRRWVRQLTSFSLEDILPPQRPDHADRAAVDSALATAASAQSDWEALGFEKRGEILRNVAASFARGRGPMIRVMQLDAKKAIAEADVEVSEAIDFANYYAMGFPEGSNDGTTSKPLGVVVVTPPWNFPFAIPVGGALAALAAGNAVILKPANETVDVAWLAANQMWDAGVPREVLQFLPMEDGPVGQHLITDARTSAVILTGSTETANLFRSWRPDLKLMAETSGKNAMVITATADLDLAIKDLVHGAFGHAGQKCSATSLALVEAEVYDSSKFRQQLLDATGSLKVGPATDLSAIVTPVIRPPDEKLKRGLIRLDRGESWLLEPKQIGEDSCLWSPGIRLGVQPDSWYHRHECFGPVLGVMRVDNLDEAIRVQNSSRFGLTGGIHSLDPAEIAKWRDQVEVGNAYINRGTTGAIVRRQPFGGWKDSCIGSGAKAGGPNYVTSLRTWQDNDSEHVTHRLPLEPDMQVLADSLAKSLPGNQRERFQSAIESYMYWWKRGFSAEHDPSQVHGQTNVFRYRARPWHIIRIESPCELPENYERQFAQAVIASHLTGCSLDLSFDEDCKLPKSLAAMTELEEVVSGRESRDEVIQAVNDWQGGTLRIWSSDPHARVLADKLGNTAIVRSNVLCNGRIELLNFLREQSISQTVHRYGTIQPTTPSAR